MTNILLTHNENTKIHSIGLNNIIKIIFNNRDKEFNRKFR